MVIRIDSESGTYTSNVIDYFQSDLQKQLKLVRMRLTEFKGSRWFLNEANQKAANKVRYRISQLCCDFRKLRFIDQVISKYTKTR